MPGRVPGSTDVTDKVLYPYPQEAMNPPGDEKSSG